jgi:hypothetical protein
MRRARWRPLPAALVLLVAVASALGVPRSAVPVSGAGPASIEVALPAGISQVALVPRADPREPAPLAAASPAPQIAAAAVTAPAPVPRADALSPGAVPVAGGRSPPAAA